jgi:hypothetical protein
MPIINQDPGFSVPENTIAVFPLKPSNHLDPFNMDYSLFLKPLNATHKRDWFASHFYHCLPLSIGNMQGFSVSLPFDFEVLWNGGNGVDDIFIHSTIPNEDFAKYFNMNNISLSSVFGHGIITINLPIQLKTPPGVNLMTIGAPNFPLSGISAMTGVVEADNLRFTFTINLKVSIPNVTIKVNKDYPVAALIPIPRYFCDSFELKDARNIFDKTIIDEELEIVHEHTSKRQISNKTDQKRDKAYYRGMDIKGNKFNDHQLPNKNK